MNLKISKLLAKVTKKKNEQRVSFATEFSKKCRTTESRVEQLQFQLNQFNASWERTRSLVPFYQKKSHPVAFDSWEMFQNTFEPISKKEVSLVSKEHFDLSTPQSFFWRSTGGTTGIPLKFPIYKSEIQKIEECEWFGRKMVDISPFDSSLRIWGHGHLFGDGFNRVVNSYVRSLKDRLLLIHRHSAYNLSNDALDKLSVEYIKQPYDYVFGYSKAIAAFAKHLIKFGIGNRRHTPPKAVICTAEAFDNEPHDTHVISKAFQCEVFMEYGSVETNLIAHMNKERVYQVAWPNFMLEILPDGDAKDRGELLITTLYPRAFPLIRYKIGDVIGGTNSTYGITEFTNVIGRNNSMIELNEHIIHSEGISHALRNIPDILAYQLVLNSHEIYLNTVTKTAKFKSLETKILAQLEKLNPDLGKISIRSVTQLESSIAGKRPTILDNRK